MDDYTTDITILHTDTKFRNKCREDFLFWAEHCVKIKPKGGGDDIPFRLNYPQRKLVALFEEMRRADRPIRVILLKARQWGGSTCTQIYMAWLQLIHRKGLNSLIIAHQSAGSEEIKDMFLRMIENYPQAMLVDEGENFEGKKICNAGRSGLAMRIPARNCKLKIGSAERPDSCRGGDYNLVHLSEVGIWKRTEGKRPEDIVRSACSGVLLKPLTMIVMESTANGTGTFFHTEYMAAARGESQFRALFIPWYEIEAYRLELTPSEREQLLLTLEEERYSDADTSRRPSGRYLYSLLQRGVSPEAIAWYLQERTKYSDQAQMAAEYPSDDIEAFAHSGARVFDREAVERLRMHCDTPEARGEIVSLRRDGEEGCLEDLHFTSSQQGGLKIWKFPAEISPLTPPLSDRYLTVVDVGGRSTKADWSVIAVFDRAAALDDNTSAAPEIVAQWRGHCDIDLLAWNATRIAAFYHNALLVIESNTLETHDANRWTEGEQSSYILQLIREQYPNLYERASPADLVREGYPTRLGFHTNTRTKPAIISHLIKIVREGLYTERDADCLDEYLRYERRPDGSYGAILGSHDDILMTRAIGLYISAFEMEPPRLLPQPCRHSPYYGRHTAAQRPRPASESTLF